MQHTHVLYWCILSLFSIRFFSLRRRWLVIWSRLGTSSPHHFSRFAGHSTVLLVSQWFRILFPNNRNLPLHLSARYSGRLLRYSNLTVMRFVQNEKSLRGLLGTITPRSPVSFTFSAQLFFLFLQSAKILLMVGKIRSD